MPDVPMPAPPHDDGNSCPVMDHPKHIIVVTRNPKDAAVSNYFFEVGFRLPGQKVDVSFQDISVADYIKLYLKGAATQYGSYWKHTREFWQIRNWDNVLLVSYENMLRDPRRHVKMVADFLGKQLTDDQIDFITMETSFKKMSGNDVTNYAWLKSIRATDATPFMRKGRCGDWKRYFTVALSEELDRINEENMCGTSLQHDYVID
ncbi:PREDICTED: 3-beta-hydroxysteroid sulfotransferase-like [Priapulus caudatus]|uniref:3-beta-hydroxysteroid sulfotransferase-like n=1 Tax=Priapulus caudatus TaxID=37621 RepID=A0ABM1F2W7_PRICU|nr:PREDICTED: 3-beta-hydroxysteroid sulfotransferase-like [Priapulus caudatus]